jgi:ABC-type sugar transport system substrate-binding protein
MRVAFLAPNVGHAGTFYQLFADFLSAAARQLQVDLEIVDGTKDRATMLARGRKIVSAPTRPDYLLAVNYLSVGADLVEAASAAGVGTFFVVEALGAELGSSGSGSGYLGQIVPDDLEAGKLLAEILTDAARSRGLRDRQGKLQVGAIAGEHTQAGSARFRGWQAFKKEHADVVQAGFQYGAWEEDTGKNAAALMLRAAPQIGVLWCANDAMALGALAAAVEAKRRPGQDILVGGVDLVDRALAEVASGRLEVSIGGHLVDGARALLLLYDHHQSGELVPSSLTTHLAAVRAPQAEQYLRFVKEHAWHEVDFTRFSRAKNPAAPPLSLETLMAG